MNTLIQNWKDMEDLIVCDADTITISCFNKHEGKNIIFEATIHNVGIEGDDLGGDVTYQELKEIWQDVIRDPKENRLERTSEMLRVGGEGDFSFSREECQWILDIMNRVLEYSGTRPDRVGDVVVLREREDRILSKLEGCAKRWKTKNDERIRPGHAPEDIHHEEREECGESGEGDDGEKSSTLNHTLGIAEALGFLSEADKCINHSEFGKKESDIVFLRDSIKKAIDDLKFCLSNKSGDEREIVIQGQPINIEEGFMPKNIIEIRVHSKFGGDSDPYVVSVLFDDGTQASFSRDFTREKAEIFTEGLKEGLKMGDAGYRINEV